MNKAAQAYFQTKVGTTDQGQLLLMLYDGALKFLQQARTKMIANDYAGKGILISKVIDIMVLPGFLWVTELRPVWDRGPGRRKRSRWRS